MAIMSPRPPYRPTAASPPFLRAQVPRDKVADSRALPTSSYKDGTSRGRHPFTQDIYNFKKNEVQMILSRPPTPPSSHDRKDLRASNPIVHPRFDRRRLKYRAYQAICRSTLNGTLCSALESGRGKTSG